MKKLSFEMYAMDKSQIFSFIPFILVFVVFYVMVLRPQQKRAEMQKALLDAIQLNDTVIMIGGLKGTVRRLQGPELEIEIANNVRVTVLRECVLQAISKNISKTLPQESL